MKNLPKELARRCEANVPFCPCVFRVSVVIFPICCRNSKQVKKLVQNLEGYSEDETFATSSLQALNGLCKSRDMCAALVEAGACEAITKVLNAHPSNMALSALAVELADHLAYNEASCARIVDLGGQEILQSLKAHSADAALVSPFLA